MIGGKMKVHFVSPAPVKRALLEFTSCICTTYYLINFNSFLKSYFLHKLPEWQDRNEWLHPTLQGQVISSTRSIGVINKQSTQVHQFHLSILPEDTVNEVLYLPQTCCNFKLLHFITALHLNDWCQELATVKLITYWHFQPLSLSLKFESNIKE